MKKFFLVTNNSSTKLHPSVIKVIKYQPFIDNLYKTTILFDQKYLNKNEIESIGIKYDPEEKLQLIPIEIPYSYFIN
jgi:hypothetical protein